MTALPEIELEFGDGLFMFRLPALYIDRLQKERGYDVTWPDGAQGKKPKPFGQIFREHMTGDYDLLDSMAVIKLGLTAGKGGIVAGASVNLDPTKARLKSEEVANLCVYAASPQASATTGAALRVEGGIVESIA